MTIQVGICCANGSIVLAGDTKVRTSGPTVSNTEPPIPVVHQPKVAYGSRHDIAVAMAGGGNIGTNAAAALAKHLASLDSVPEFLEPILVEWGGVYFQQQVGDQFECSLLVVNPRAERLPLWKLRVGQVCISEPSTESMVNGNESNAAIFWLEYMQPKNDELSLESATGIAITTVLSAGQLDNQYIGGLEVHQYDKGLWYEWSRTEINQARHHFTKAHDQIKRIVLDCGVRPVTPPQV